MNDTKGDMGSHFICQRCKRTTLIGDDDFTGYEIVRNEMVCFDCLSPEEHGDFVQQMAEMEWEEEHGSEIADA